MGRTALVPGVAAAVAFGWGLGAAALGEAQGWDPLVASLSLLVPVASFGRLRRGREPVEIVAGGVAVAYAAYAGLALVRALRPEYAAPFVRIAPDSVVTAVALIAGVPLALLLAICVALPLARAPRPHLDDAARSERFWALVRRSLGDDQPYSSEP